MITTTGDLGGARHTLGSLLAVNFGQSPLTNALSKHHQVAVRILDKDLLLSRLAVARPPPNLPWTEIDRPISCNKIVQNRAEIFEVDLKHRALSKRMLHRSRFETTMTLAKHHLLAFGMLQINKLFFLTPEGNFKADDVDPKIEADRQVSDMKLGHDFRPAGFWRSVTVSSHIDKLPKGGKVTRVIVPSLHRCSGAEDHGGLR
jgi:hypothetical protein